jgi:hypothetical protein
MREEQENPICLVDLDLPTPPEGWEIVMEPHPDEPGAPLDAPDARALRETSEPSK